MDEMKLLMGWVEVVADAGLFVEEEEVVLGFVVAAVVLKVEVEYVELQQDD